MNDATTSDDPGYRVLARKYRPSDFSDLIGQEPMVRTLTNAFETGRIAQAYMLTGVRGVGKTTTARILARALNYRTDTVDKPSIDLSTTGEHCEAIMQGSHVDVIEMDAASHTGIDDIREIIEQVRYRPVSARYKVYIIDEIHMLSTQAFNGLLKTLEEPPAHVKFIFATTEIRKVPVTVLSRCQRFDLRRIEAATLVDLFRGIAEKEKVSIDDESLAMIARAAEGSARDGLSLLDQAIAHGGGDVEAEAVRAMLGLADRSQVVELFDQVARGDVAEALQTFRQQYDSGANPAVVLTDLADFTHLVTRLKFVPDAASDASLSETERVRGGEFAEKLSVPVLSRLWQMLLKGITETEQSNRPVNACEMVLIRLTHAANLPSPGEAVKAFSERPAHSAPGKNRPSPATDAPQAPASGYDAQPASSGSGPVAALRPVESENPAPQMQAAPVTSAPTVTVTSLADLADLAGQHRDVKLKAMIRKYLRPVKMEAGRLEIALHEDAPKSLIGELDGKLKEWTGMRWIIAISREKGGRTIEEMEAAHRAELVSDASQDPDVAAILQQFPGARITDVRIRADEAEPLVSQQSEDGDILPDDPEI
ncbi:DNA polymerase III subunit gamma/tau [Hoeflea prorocentri]|uniref:DNA polymerase III subunit gamma/tau n=1 Tax=Hoeflea prorocentri TaxID=1922333 RepID=A0A9X3ULE8_9HYPH|nr:DNA polymerase III subunit gamma/tau [Hoeflea prorocentri]MCY6382928.1 DNA polymerase III subunit gamma/tau [Hoeflea prorocentri]MDA5400728.1 DNA polymerase III subunit gamma/tau [Hoeflea prorocentri]